MKKEYAMRWADVLESGKYRQTRNHLKCALPGKHVGYCCLGVAEKEFGDVPIDMLDDSDVLSDSTRERMGMHSPTGSLRGNDQLFRIKDNYYDSLVEANDDGVGFKDIAKFIRKNWKYL